MLSFQFPLDMKKSTNVGKKKYIFNGVFTVRLPAQTWVISGPCPSKRVPSVLVVISPGLLMDVPSRVAQVQNALFHLGRSEGVEARVLR